MASRLVRASAVTVNDVLDGHKLLEIDCVDRAWKSQNVQKAAAVVQQFLDAR